jgi:inositol polyphosphate 5-phosphatase INPP5B/F
VSAHLAAHRENVEGRNSDFASIVQKTLFLEKGGGAGGGAGGADAAGAEASAETRRYFAEVLEVEPTIGTTGVGILDHDVVFWVGDLNYRLDESVDTEECFGKIEAQDFDFLRRYDQLNMERAAGRVFQGFTEALLTFPPTYKYQPGTSGYERRPEKKLRCPAWCDRVLWRAKDPSQVRCLSYRRAVVSLSDHMPVAGQLQAKVRMVVQEKKREVAAEIHRLLDKVENDQKPRLQLECPDGAVAGRPPNTLDFGLVRYAVAATRTLVVTNVSPVAAHFRFVPKLEEEAICKPWLQIKPRFGMLLPNERAEIAFTVHVDLPTAQALNRGEALLDDILILRLENGQDFFLSAQGQYARSCFGMSLDELNNCPGPVRALPLPTGSYQPLPPPPVPPAPAAPTPSSSSSSSSNINHPALAVPKELWRLVDALYRTGLAEKDLFIQPGVPGEAAAIREALDTGAELGQVSAQSLAEVLMAFLQSLAAPVVPARLLPTMEVRLCVRGGEEGGREGGKNGGSCTLSVYVCDR